MARTKGRAKTLGKKRQQGLWWRDSGKSAQKGKHGGKGKAKQDQTCHTCGSPGHFARDCWRNVRQVAQPSESTTLSSTATVSETTAIMPQSSIKRVMEVSQPEHFAQESAVRVFDLRTSSEPSAGGVRVVQFYIGDPFSRSSQNSHS